MEMPRGKAFNVNSDIDRCKKCGLTIDEHHSTTLAMGGVADPVKRPVVVRDVRGSGGREKKPPRPAYALKKAAAIQST